MIIKKTFIYLCCLIHHKWGEMPCDTSISGAFLVLNNCGIVPPCVSCNGLPAHLCELDNGKGNTVFYCLISKCLTHMVKTKTKGIPTQGIEAMHAVHRPEQVQRLLHKSFNELINDFFIEMDAKNFAYYFILENGYLEEFKNYSQTKNL